MIEIKNGFKSYPEKRVLADFSLRLPETGAVAVLGPSGSGKTTLLRVLAGLERLDSGEITVRRGTKISMVFQEDRLLPALDVRGNLLAVLGKSASDRRFADECLERCGLSEASAQRVSTLSGGMKRRVAIARAVAFGGDVLLLDEPFKGLDEALKKKVADFVFEGCSNRLTVFITHDLAEARQYAHKLLRFSGPPLFLEEELE